MRILIVGWGYVGSFLGARLAEAGHQVIGVRRRAVTETGKPDEDLIAKRDTREANDLSVSARARVNVLQADITDREQLQGLPTGYDWVVNCAASSGGGPEAYEAVYVRGNTNLLEWLQNAPPRKLVYTSSTGVYGQNAGETVDEQSATEPDSPTGQALVRAEGLLLRAARERGFPAIILRLAGIYGPGRGYWLKQFLEGNAALEGDGARILNMIHRDDVAGATVAALEKGAAGDVCNVVDNEPASQRQVFAWLAQRLVRPMPPAVPSDSVLRKRGATNKRVSNLRLRRDYGYTLKYPTFREGFEAELREQRSTAANG